MEGKGELIVKRRGFNFPGGGRGGGGGGGGATARLFRSKGEYNRATVEGKEKGQLPQLKEEGGGGKFGRKVSGRKGRRIPKREGPPTLSQKERICGTKKNHEDSRKGRGAGDKHSH